MTTRKLTAGLTALALAAAGVGAGCSDRENQKSGNQGQKAPEGGVTSTPTSPGATAAPGEAGE